MSGIITLTTDFGHSDPWVGIMKGVILSIRPKTKIIDITHDIFPQNIRQADICLDMLRDSFPPNTVHMAIVDPGVGSNREAIIIQTERYYYVGPNNGVFSSLDSPVVKAVRIENTQYTRQTISVTFHGRDIFAPVAAHLPETPIEEFGPAVKNLVTLDIPSAYPEKKGEISGEIIYFDRFGNAFTNVTGKMLVSAQAKGASGRLEIEAGKRRINSISYYYQSAKSGELGAIINSFGYMELFTPNGNARELFKLKMGEKVKVRLIAEKS